MKQIKDLLKYKHQRDLSFQEYMELVLNDPQEHLKLSTDIILDAIKSYGYKITMRNGQPVICYNVFKDPFTRGLNAIYGQETCIKQVIDIIYSINKETGPNRGIILVGPPASGKTNIIDLMTKAVEEYVKNSKISLYTFSFVFEEKVFLRTSFNHNPLLLFPTSLKTEEGTANPRQDLFDILRDIDIDLTIPSFYKDATLDKKVVDIIEGLVRNPANSKMDLYEILNKYVVISEFEYSLTQGRGVSNIDKMEYLKTDVRKVNFHRNDVEAIKKHLPDLDVYQYSGSLVASNRGILHIHDAFDVTTESNLISSYKPLLLLLGSGKINVESTQIPLDNVTVMTTNLEEMANLEKYLTSVKLLDRIEKIPVNYLIDMNAEIDLLKRDVQGYKKDYDIDPNFFKISAYFSVMTRLRKPERPNEHWKASKAMLFKDLSPEQKMVIYASKTNNIGKLLRDLPYWHPFCTEARQLGIDLKKPETYQDHIEQHPDAVDLKDCGLFSDKEIGYIDDDFKNWLRKEHWPKEGNTGISTRQMQNILRDVILKSDNKKITVSLFISQLGQIVAESAYVNSWMATKDQMSDEDSDYYDVEKLILILQCLYSEILKKEITICITDRDPDSIENDLRRYLQYLMLHNARLSTNFSRVLIQEFAFIDKLSGQKIKEPDYSFMESIEDILVHNYKNIDDYRDKMAKKFLEEYRTGVLTLKVKGNIIGSKDDNIVSIFVKEYKVLLSNSKVNDSVNTTELKNAFFFKLNDMKAYNICGEKIKEMCEKIINNMVCNFSYSKDTALEAIIYAFKENIIDLSEIIKREDNNAKEK